MRWAYVVAMALGLYALYATIAFSVPLASVDSPMHVDIKRGMTFREATDVLVSHGLVRNPNIFVALARLTGVHTQIKPGRYVFTGDVSPWEVFTSLRDGRVTYAEFTVYEGDTLERIRERMVREELMSPAAFDRMAHDQAFLVSEGIHSPTLEGYLYPETYYIEFGLEPKDVVRPMLRRMREAFDPYATRMSALRMSMNEVLTLASIVEKEAAVDEERAMISAVYHNRLRKGMRLQADPTVIYGVKPLSEGITRQDLSRETPYNTYRINGLPPGPIASPGQQSIEAALYPSDAPYIFFVSNNDGTHTFTTTLTEHRRAVKSYRIKRLILGAKQAAVASGS